MKASIHRPTRAYVDVEAIAYNVQQIQAHIPKETLTFAVVKADAYGHGVEPVVERLLPLVDAFCVSNLDEALEKASLADHRPARYSIFLFPDNWSNRSRSVSVNTLEANLGCLW